MAKKLEKGSIWEQADADGDGVVTDENNDKMQDQQRLICWVSSISSIALILVAMSPIIPDARIEMVTALLSTYVVANLGIVATFMATSAFARNSDNKK